MKKQDKEMVQAMQISQCHKDDTVPSNAKVNSCAGHLNHCECQEMPKAVELLPEWHPCPPSSREVGQLGHKNKNPS